MGKKGVRNGSTNDLFCRSLLRLHYWHHIWRDGCFSLSTNDDQSAAPHRRKESGHVTNPFLGFTILGIFGGASLGFVSKGWKVAVFLALAGGAGFVVGVFLSIVIGMGLGMIPEAIFSSAEA